MFSEIIDKSVAKQILLIRLFVQLGTLMKTLEKNKCHKKQTICNWTHLLMFIFHILIFLIQGAAGSLNWSAA